MSLCCLLRAVSHPYPLSNPWPPLTPVLCYFKNFTYKWNPKFVTFWGWLFSQQVPWSPIPFLACFNNSFLFFVEYIHGMDTSMCLAIYPSKSIWVVFGLGLLQKEKPWTVTYGFLCWHKFSFLWDQCLKSTIAESFGKCSQVKRNCHTVFQTGCTMLCSIMRNVRCNLQLL